MLKKLIFISLFLLPGMNRGGNNKPEDTARDHYDLYAVLHLSEKGLSMEAFELALKGYYRLKTTGKLRNSGILTIADFSQSSRNKRLYVIDLSHKALLFNTYVTHGMKTGQECAEYFSNTPGSKKSSLGFYVTREERMASTVGLSLVLEGMEKGFNDNALKRGIILHGADYATEKVIRRIGMLGRSYGCPAVPPDLTEPVINTIKEGTCLFIYQHDNQYLSNSTLLN